MRAALVVFLCAASVAAQQSPAPQQHSRLFPPRDLGLLEAPDRDLWQHPDRIMDSLGIAEATTVADIGAGGGWFTIRLARRVGPNGVVVAQDVQPEMLAAITRRVQSEGLQNVRTIRGEEDNANLPPATFDAILISDVYHEIDEKVRVPMLRTLATALKRDGRIGIVDFRLEGSGPGPPTNQRVKPESVIDAARQAGLRVLRQETYLPYQYFLIFVLDATTDRATRAPAAPTRPAALRPPRTP